MNTIEVEFDITQIPRYGYEWLSILDETANFSYKRNDFCLDRALIFNIGTNVYKLVHVVKNLYYSINELNVILEESIKYLSQKVMGCKIYSNYIDFTSYHTDEVVGDQKQMFFVIEFEVMEKGNVS